MSVGEGFGYDPGQCVGRPLFPEAEHFSAVRGADVRLVGRGPIAESGRPFREEMELVVSSRAFLPGDFEALRNSCAAGSAKPLEGVLEVEEIVDDGDLGISYAVMGTDHEHYELMCASERNLKELLSAFVCLMCSTPQAALAQAREAIAGSRGSGDYAALSGAHLIAAMCFMSEPYCDDESSQTKAICHVFNSCRVFATDLCLSLLEKALGSYSSFEPLLPTVEEYLEELAPPVDFGDGLLIGGMDEAALALARSKSTRGITQAAPWILEAASRGYAEECASIIGDAFENSCCSVSRAMSLLREVAAHADDPEGFEDRHVGPYSELGFSGLKPYEVLVGPSATAPLMTRDRVPEDLSMSQHCFRLQEVDLHTALRALFEREYGGHHSAGHYASLLSWAQSQAVESGDIVGDVVITKELASAITLGRYRL